MEKNMNTLAGYRENIPETHDAGTEASGMSGVEEEIKICRVCGKPVRVIKSFIVTSPGSTNYMRRIDNPPEFTRPVHGKCILKS